MLLCGYCSVGHGANGGCVVGGIILCGLHYGANSVVTRARQYGLCSGVATVGIWCCLLWCYWHCVLREWSIGFGINDGIVGYCVKVGGVVVGIK